MWRKVRGRWRGIPWTRYYLAFETGHGMASWKKCKAPWKRCTISKNIEKELMQRIVQREIAKGNTTWKREASWQRPRLIWPEIQEAKRCVLVCNFWFWAGKGFVFRFFLHICSLSDWFLNQSNQSQNIDFRPKSILIKDYWLESIFDAQGNSHVVTMSVLCRHHVVSMPMCHVKTMSSL